MHYTWNGAYTIERREKVGVLGSDLPPLTRDSAASPLATMCAHVYAQSGHIPKAAATLTPKDQTSSVILIEGEDLSIQVPIKYLSFPPWTSAVPYSTCRNPY